MKQESNQVTPEKIRKHRRKLELRKKATAKRYGVIEGGIMLVNKDREFSFWIWNGEEWIAQYSGKLD